ncbi:hypothetical protein FRX31_032814 [Thalictrum thalictroides]|uniref:Uncharacterized protein n=1 Tax=Thalictrum thalictroides TaxID=46969 RepID=A0A7J6UYC8_THATH|nr:hypothetical protein FRX31_032814 [Thalictrum thalictroides]
MDKSKKPSMNLIFKRCNAPFGTKTTNTGSALNTTISASVSKTTQSKKRSCMGLFYRQKQGVSELSDRPKAVKAHVS